MKEALRVYSQEGIYGSYFDNNDDVMEDANFMTFEMGKIMEKPKVLLPVLEYLFHRIETEKLGKDIPTLDCRRDRVAQCLSPRMLSEAIATPR